MEQSNVAENWLVIIDVYGTPAKQKLVLNVDADKLSGTEDGNRLQGSISGNTLHFTTKNGDVTEAYEGTISGDTLSGTLVRTDKNPLRNMKTTWTARRIQLRRPGSPQRHEFVPTTFYREFSADNKPVLTIWPGDTVHTTTVDAAGADEKGVTRVLGGNPETGPFYVETAMPGDVLAIHFNRIRLNRDYAISDDRIVARALGPQSPVKLKDTGQDVLWHLDRARGLAASESPGEHLKNFTVPIRPMLGCVAVAPGFGSTPPSARDSGAYGGNMDLNEIVEAVTVYLPVAQPGALLYVGDGHAAQGDGELNGNALETSMEVEFTVDLIPSKSILMPRVESPSHLIALGLGGSVDDATRLATSNAAQWLEQDYNLTPSEIAQVLGTSAEYSINELADRNAGVIVRLRKDRLAKLNKPLLH